MNKTSSSLLLKRSFKFSITNIWRNKILSLATIFVIGISLFIFNIILAINFIAQNAIKDLNEKVDITIYLKENTTYQDVENLTNEISLMDGVQKVNYTSKEDAIKQLETTHPDLVLSFQKYKLKNPLPASLNIITTDPKFHEPISEALNQDRYKAYLSNIISNQTKNNPIISSVSKNLEQLSTFTGQIIFWLIITFILGAALIILNALQITIFNRKKEISVMKLVGASHFFIRAPFIIEAIIYGLLGVILSFIMVTLVSYNIEIQQTKLWDYYMGIDFYLIFIIEILGTITLSILSSIIAIEEHIQKNILED